MPEIELREQLRWFAEQMETVLGQNDHRGGWESETWEYLFVHLEDKIKELTTEFYKEGYDNIFDSSLNENVSAIIRKAIDVANYAMMIADNLRGEE